MFGVCSDQDAICHLRHHCVIVVAAAIAVLCIFQSVFLVLFSSTIKGLFQSKSISSWLKIIMVDLWHQNQVMFMARPCTETLWTPKVCGKTDYFVPRRLQSRNVLNTSCSASRRLWVRVGHIISVFRGTYEPFS